MIRPSTPTSPNMSPNDQKPDLDESINVAEAHGRVVREAAAAAREKRILAAGNEPISVWVLSACGLALVFAGAILGNAGTFLDYDSLYRKNYVRASAPGAEASGPLPKAALDAYMAKGSKIYTAKCNGCHGADAKGDGANFPSLVGSPWVTGQSETFAMIVLNGLQGPASSGKTYGLMPSQAAGLSPEDLAGVLTYVRNNFGNSTGDVISVEMAKSAMEISANRSKAGQPLSAEEIKADHDKALPGDPVDPSMMVDPVTLVPVEVAAP